MASLAVRTLVDRGVDPERIAVANRTIQRAHELVATFGVRAVVWDDLDAELADTDVVISCTGAAGVVFDRAAHRRRVGTGRPLTFVDLALPRDVDPSATLIEGVTSSTSSCWGSAPRTPSSPPTSSRCARSSRTRSARSWPPSRRRSVTPTVVALRSMATEVVEAEVARITTRMPDLRTEEVEQVRRSLQRVADKLIHAPTVRVQQLVEGPGGLTYADALADLFALDQAAVEAVTRVGGEEA